MSKILEPVTILIPSRYNNRLILELNIKTIRKYTTDYPYKIIIGDAGIDKETMDFLTQQNDIEIVVCPDQKRPKDHLARICNTKYFIFFHDDIHILRPGWLSRRVEIMETNPQIGVSGVMGNNLIPGWKWKQFIPFLPVLYKRFFPLMLMVRNETQKELDLTWSKIKGFDTGAIAYYQFCRQKKWKFKPYPFKHDIKHWGAMTWVVQHKTDHQPSKLDLNNLLLIRTEKEQLIKKILESGQF
ncbi:MAG: hypothetical protein HQL26_05330 [Candidatus Omnitrophica bacterium]|nr:hypothetical protein [Candidatus Omnitrophota bacterium]